MISTAELFDLGELSAELAELLSGEHPWDALARLDGSLARAGSGLEGKVHPTAVLEGAVLVANGATVGPGAYIQGPAIIESGARVGHGAYLRGGVWLATGSVVGHSSEVKRSIMLPGAKAPHFNYVGDSVIGRNANLGAGVKIANFHAFGTEISSGGHATGLRKLGAMVGDDVFIGCNAVLAPGTMVGARSVIYNGSMVRGVVPPDRIVKLRVVQEITGREAR